MFNKMASQVLMQNPNNSNPEFISLLSEGGKSVAGQVSTSVDRGLDIDGFDLSVKTLLAFVLILGMVSMGAAASSISNLDYTFSGHTGYINDVAVDSDGYVYSAANDVTLRKIDGDGNQINQFKPYDPYDIRAVTVDSNGNIYISGGASPTVKKLDSSGNQVWEFTGLSDDVNDIVLDSSGNVYTGGDSNTVRKIDSSGNQVWKFTGHSSNVEAVAVDSNGNVYSGGGYDDHTLRKIDSSGNQVWNFTDHSDQVRGVAVDSNGYVYSGSLDNTIRKIDSSGTQVWSYTNQDYSAYDIAVNSKGQVYSAGELSSGDSDVLKISSTGNLLDSLTSTGNAHYIDLSPLSNSKHYITIGATDNVYRLTNDLNSAPNIDSKTVSPDPFNIETVSYSADVSDNEDSDSNLDTTLTVYDDGSQVYSSTKTGSTPSWADVYTTTEGSINAEFTVTDTAGKSTTKWINRTVTNTPPTADFTTNSPVLTSEDFGLDASSTSDPDTQSLTYSWDFNNDGVFGDDTGSISPSHSKSDDGTYSITLKVDDGIDTDTTSTTVNVENREPTASFTKSTSDKDLSVDGTGSNDQDGSISSYEWDWTNDGTYESTGSTTSHTYSSGGSYTVGLRVTDDDGATSTTTKTVEINDDPVASITSNTPVLTSEDFGLDASGSTDTEDTSLSYTWDLNDDGVYGDGDGTATPSNSEADNGDYPITVKVTDSEGATDTASTTVTVENRNPTADFTVSHTTATNVDGSNSNDQDGSTSTYEWDWTSDGNYEATGQTASFNYNSGSNQDITLKITDDDGATDTKTQTVTPPSKPSASLTTPLTGNEFGIAPIDVNFEADITSEEEQVTARFILSDDTNGNYNSQSIFSTTQSSQSTVTQTATENLGTDNYTWYAEMETDYYGTIQSSSESFEVLPAGTLNVVMTEPSGDIIVEQGETFNMSGYVECNNGVCAEPDDTVEVWADPIETENPVKVDEITGSLTQGEKVGFENVEIEKGIKDKYAEEDLSLKIQSIDAGKTNKPSTGLIQTLSNLITEIMTVL